MIRHPLGLRLDPNRLGPRTDPRGGSARCPGRRARRHRRACAARLSETGRREMRHVLRTVELALVALSLPTRRPFDTTDQLDERIRRADSRVCDGLRAGHEGRSGCGPARFRRKTSRPGARCLRLPFASSGTRAEHRGVRLALETGSEPAETLKSFLDAIGLPGLAASIDPAHGLQTGMDPVESVRELAAWVVHAYANDAIRSSQFGGAQPARVRISARRPRLGRIPRCSRRDRLSRLLDDLARAGRSGRNPV